MAFARLGVKAFDGRRVLTILLLAVFAYAPSPLTDAATAQEDDGVPQRIVALDWGIAETLLTLGKTPVGIPETDNYREIVKRPQLPDRVVNLGLRIEPNLEAIDRLDPDLIVVNSSQEASMGARLRRIAPTRGFSVFSGEGAPYDQAAQLMLDLGRLLDRTARAQQYVEETRRILSQRDLSACARQHPLYLISMLNARHIMIYGDTSLFQRPLTRLGLENAWAGPTNHWGYTIGSFSQLAENPDARVIHVGPIPEEKTAGLTESVLWNSLPFVRQGRMSTMPDVWVFGALPTARRFGTLLAQTLEQECAHG